MTVQEGKREDGVRPMPAVKRACKRCDPPIGELRIGFVVVSPGGTAHMEGIEGDTRCGIDATGDNWWWPL